AAARFQNRRGLVPGGRWGLGCAFASSFADSVGCLTPQAVTPPPARATAEPPIVAASATTSTATVKPRLRTAIESQSRGSLTGVLSAETTFWDRRAHFVHTHAPSVFP